MFTLCSNAMTREMWTNLNDPARALQLLCKQASVLEMIGHRPEGLVHNQVAALNETVRILRALTAMISQDSYGMNSRRDEVAMIKSMRENLEQKWLKSPILSESAKAIVSDLIKQLDELHVTLHGGFAKRMFPMLDGSKHQVRAQRFSDFKEFYLNMGCEDCPATSRGIALVYEDIHVPDLVEITGGDHVWGQYKFKCPANPNHTVRPSMYSGKGRTNKPRGLLLGKPYTEYLQQMIIRKEKGNIDHDNAN